MKYKKEILEGLIIDLGNNSQAKDFFQELPEHVKKGIEKSLQQSKEGLVIPHEEVMKKYAKYL
jgi:predicted transcriptional regulator